MVCDEIRAWGFAHQRIPRIREARLSELIIAERTHHSTKARWQQMVFDLPESAQESTLILEDNMFMEIDICAWATCIGGGCWGVHDVCLASESGLSVVTDASTLAFLIREPPRYATNQMVTSLGICASV